MLQLGEEMPLPGFAVEARGDRITKAEAGDDNEYCRRSAEGVGGERMRALEHRPIGGAWRW